MSGLCFGRLPQEAQHWKRTRGREPWPSHPVTRSALYPETRSAPAGARNQAACLSGGRRATKSDAQGFSIRKAGTREATSAGTSRGRPPHLASAACGQRAVDCRSSCPRRADVASGAETGRVVALVVVEAGRQEAAGLAGRRGTSTRAAGTATSGTSEERTLQWGSRLQRTAPLDAGGSARTCKLDVSVRECEPLNASREFAN